jgi:hypothetical protein
MHTTLPQDLNVYQLSLDFSMARSYMDSILVTQSHTSANPSLSHHNEPLHPSVCLLVTSTYQGRDMFILPMPPRCLELKPGSTLYCHRLYKTKTRYSHSSRGHCTAQQQEERSPSTTLSSILPRGESHLRLSSPNTSDHRSTTTFNRLATNWNANITSASLNMLNPPLIRHVWRQGGGERTMRRTLDSLGQLLTIMRVSVLSSSCTDRSS